VRGVVPVGDDDWCTSYERERCCNLESGLLNTYFTTISFSCLYLLVSFVTVVVLGVERNRYLVALSPGIKKFSSAPAL
jgi:hypothetical protein